MQRGGGRSAGFPLCAIITIWLSPTRNPVELAKESESEANPFTKAQISMIVTKEDIEYYTEVRRSDSAFHSS